MRKLGQAGRGPSALLCPGVHDAIKTALAAGKV